MAKFQQGSLELNDNQKVIFGSDDDSSLYWDGTELRLTTTISGVTPTQSYHLVTKQYADTLSGTSSSGITDIVQDTTPQLGGNLDTNGYNINFGNTVISGTTSGVIVTGGHGTASHAEVVNTVYGTSTAPTISGSNITEGTLFIKYTV